MSLCARCQANYDEDQINSDTVVVSGGWYAPTALLAATIFNEPTCEPVELMPYSWHFKTNGWNLIKALRSWQENKEDYDSGAILHGYPGPLKNSLPEIKASRGGIQYQRIQLETND